MYVYTYIFLDMLSFFSLLFFDAPFFRTPLHAEAGPWQKTYFIKECVVFFQFHLYEKHLKKTSVHVRFMRN